MPGPNMFMGYHAYMAFQRDCTVSQDDALEQDEDSLISLEEAGLEEPSEEPRYGHASIYAVVEAWQDGDEFSVL